MWNPDTNETSPNFVAALYGENSDDEDDDTRYFEEYSDDEVEPVDRDASSPIPPPYAPITCASPSARPFERGAMSRERDDRAVRSRSRSPIRKMKPFEEGAVRSRSHSPIRQIEPVGVVVCVYDDAGTPMRDEFFAPDSHVLYNSVDPLNESIESLDESLDLIERGNGRGRSLRGRVRGRRGGRARSRGQRGRGRGAGRRRRQDPRWQFGEPLEEVWLTDDDVPPELRQMATDVIRRRQARVIAMETRRNAGRICDVRVRNEGENSESENDDVFEDATDGRGNSLMEGVDLHFDWSPMETFRGVEETFIPERTGSVISYKTPYDAFRSYWDDGILQMIVDRTNKNANRIKSASFHTEWYPTNVDELLCLFAFWMMTGIIRMPTIASYFSNNALLKTDVFSKITTLKRYNNLTRSLHFLDSDSNPTDSDNAKFYQMHCLRPIIDHLNTKFQSNYVLSKDICIDESLTLWKGRLDFRQYIRSKAAKFGIKTFELCESATGYLWSFVVYTGKQINPSDTGLSKSTEIVLKLIEPLLNKGYRLFMDNWFNSPLLARYLKRNGTDCVGTLRAFRVDVPRLVMQAPLKQGQLVARHSGDVCVMSWMDKKRINMISTCHGVATALPSVSSRPPNRPEQFKPQSVLDYNRCMGGVDLKDQMLEPYLLERKRCAKWYIKLFKRLLNTSVHNARVLLESSLNERKDNLTFRLELVHAILTNHHSHIPLARRAESFHRRSAPFPHIVHHTHWPVRVPQTETDLANNRHSRQKCVVCLQEGRKSQRTYFRCEDCNVPLCVEDCFKKFHTVLK